VLARGRFRVQRVQATPGPGHTTRTKDPTPAWRGEEAALGDAPAGAASHAGTSAGLKRAGSAGWAAATVVLGRARAAGRDREEAGGLRETTKERLRHLVADLDGYRGAEGLREAVRGRA